MKLYQETKRWFEWKNLNIIEISDTPDLFSNI